MAHVVAQPMREPNFMRPTFRHFAPYRYSSIRVISASKVLEMIHGRPSSLSGRENKAFADRLMGRDPVDRASLRVKARARFKGKMRVVLRAVSLVLFTV